MYNQIDSFYEDAVSASTNKTFAISNQLIPYLMTGLTFLELKLILREIATINKSTSEILPHKWSVSETVEDLNLSSNSKNIYTHISKSIENLSKKIVQVRRKGEETLVIPWLTRGQYNNKIGGRFGLALNVSLKPFLICLEKDFTVFETDIIKKFSTARVLGTYMYMYSLFKKHHCKTQGESAGINRIIETNDLKRLMDIPDNYRFRDINKKVLLPIKRQIEENTDFIFDFEPVKEGRKHIGYKIFFSPSKHIRKYIDGYNIRPMAYEKLSGTERLCLSTYAKCFHVSTEEFCRVRNMLLDFEIWGAEKLMASVEQSLMNIEANIVYCITRYKDKLEKMELAAVICKAIQQNYVGNNVEKQKQVLQIARRF